ncbi:MAG: tRNA preQ1(34) S-adenosylmethionine ribosyltransferase-isomerase QueA [Desulfobacteraceae bacterium]|nr:MAG: tRNA preQ1(34) S-adenosylmethionine ribosyltransferase-isomerase QueA [Desulfobacteraceae bacterium]
MFSLCDYHYELPGELIAQHPAPARDRCRLLLLDRKTGRRTHCQFCSLSDFLNPSDVLVVNNTRVIPGRLSGKKETGGKVELLLLDYGTPRGTGKPGSGLLYECLMKSSKKAKPGTVLRFEKGLSAEVIAAADGRATVRFMCEGDFGQMLEEVGQVPLPPYIHRHPDAGLDDKTAYQTVYASRSGAVAAPTAGLHFSREMLDALKTRGVRIVEITLHIGYGTFQPVRSADIRCHRMHPEWFHISREAAGILSEARSSGSRIVAVGTTAVRSLEFAADAEGNVQEGSGDCDLFIYPGYRFKFVDALLTNFHLPESTLLMLVSAFAGRERILEAYREAIEERYRFFSYGDAMLIV